MSKIDIIKNELYIKGVDRVVENFILKSKIDFCLPRNHDGFIFITGGQCDYSFDDGAFFCAKAGDLLYLAKDSVYKMDITSDKYSFIFCDFDFGENEKRQSRVFSFLNSSEIKILFDRILFLYQAKRVAWQSECSMIIYSIYSKIVKACEIYSSKQYKDIAYNAQSYILENLSDESLSIKETAKSLRVSEVHLRRVFSAVFWMSPIKYIISSRITRAKELLAISYVSIEEIVEQCGFSSIPYFFRTFKLITGQTPMSYRRQSCT